MIRDSIIVAFLFTIFLPCSAHIAPLDESSVFIKDFVENYGFSVEERYTHEYHETLLRQTAKSFTQLEERLKKSGFHQNGRILISGYEENAIPTYHTDCFETKIDDEATTKVDAGWSLKLHNRFGVMTGFLFKDVAYLRPSKQMRAAGTILGGGDPIVHVNADKVEIFGQGGHVFRKHAFGAAYESMKEFKDAFEDLYEQQGIDNLLDHLITFWWHLYDNDIKSQGRRVAATQDIMFSTAYAKYLKSSSSQVLHFYTGPDITYPIETFVSQGTDATRHAQAFVPELVEKIRPINDKNTVYIFCSFVDGVGKSTMLGNVKNYLTYGNNVAKYERVDNSSSQYADLFKAKDKVFIADLPAQISHFTYKPDGLVYVDVETELSKDEISELRLHILANKDELRLSYPALHQDVQGILEKDGSFAEELWDPSRPDRAFMKNLILLRRESTSTWIPFEFKGKHYVFNYYQDGAIRILRTLAGAASSGLKNIDSEQMLFFDGIRFPLSYDVFLQDLEDKLSAHGIEEIVYVDFVSMYPRSQRENIRINYLMQQLAHLDPQFDTERSLYKHFVQPSELFADLLKKKTRGDMTRHFVDETALRLALYEMLISEERKTLDGLSIKELTDALQEKIAQYKKGTLFGRIQSIVQDKVTQEYARLYETFGLTKQLNNVQLFSFELAMALSDYLARLFSTQEENEHLAALWSGLGGLVLPPAEMIMGQLDANLTLDSGRQVYGLFEYHPACRDEEYLTLFLQQFRSLWYGAAKNVLHGFKEVVAVPPALIIPGTGEDVFAVRPQFAEPAEGTEGLVMPKGLHLLSYTKPKWGVFDNVAYCLTWNNDGADYGVFGCDCNIGNPMEPSNTVTSIVYRYQKEHGRDTIMPTSELYEHLMESDAFARDRYTWLSTAKEKKARADDDQGREESKEQDGNDAARQPWGPKKKIIDPRLGQPHEVAYARLFVQLLATIDMLIKDPLSDVIIRIGNREDFAAGLLLIEQLILPKYFGLIFEHPLFEDYSDVEPIVPWTLIDEVLGIAT